MGPAHRLGDGGDGLVLADDPPVQVSSSFSSRSRSSSVSWDTGMPVARETTSAMSLAVTSGTSACPPVSWSSWARSWSISVFNLLAFS